MPTYRLRTISHSLSRASRYEPLPLVHITRDIRIFISLEGRAVWVSPATVHEQELLLPACINTHPLDLRGKDTLIAASEIRPALFPNSLGEPIPGYDISFTRGDGTGFVEACDGKEGTFALCVTGRNDIDHDAAGTFTFTKDTFALIVWLRLYGRVTAPAATQALPSMSLAQP